MKLIALLCALTLGAVISRAAADTPASVLSPDGNVEVTFSLSAAGEPQYRVDYLGKPVVTDSRLGLEPNLLSGFSFASAKRGEHRGAWTNTLGERRNVPENYNELTVRVAQKDGRLLDLVFRAYDEGAALRYTFPEQPTKALTLSGERTEFRFPAGTFGYEEHATEGEYRRALLAEFEPWVERPVTVELPDGRWAAVAEAANLAYPRMLLSPLPGAAGGLVTALGGATATTVSREFAQRHDPTAKMQAGGSTPWRMFVVGKRAGDLLERNYLMLNLNEPSALADTSWIKPGKAMRDTLITTANSKAIIDLAAKAGLNFVHLDWKWYGGVEYEAAGDTTVRAPNLDIPEIVRYGRGKGVGLILYIDRRQAMQRRDEIFKQMEDWGVVGVKIGFVDVGPQAATAWITETIRSAAKHHLMLNIHDGYRSTGISRTWPNLMTVEGIRGNEHFPTAAHNCTLPFTRYIAGIGDYTVCYYDKRLKNTTHAHQLAMAVVSFSPLQWIFWYDKPTAYEGEPEVEFFREVPTVWDETRVLDGRVGEFAVLARRKGQDWFIGAINADTARTVELPLTFLAPGRTYVAHVYSDDPAVPTKTHVRVSTRTVGSDAVLGVQMPVSGGQAIWLEAPKENR